MDIRNTTQFVTFISKNNLIQYDAAMLQLVNCINGYKSACDCYKKEEKLAKDKEIEEAKRKLAEDFRLQLMIGMPNNADESGLQRLAAQSGCLRRRSRADLPERTRDALRRPALGAPRVPPRGARGRGR